METHSLLESAAAAAVGVNPRYGSGAGVSVRGKSAVTRLVTVHISGKKCHFLEVRVPAGTRALH